MKKISLILFVVMFFGNLHSQELRYTKRNRNEIREGPCNYYPLLFVLPAGIPLKVGKEEVGWYDSKVYDKIAESSSMGGWISKNCFTNTSNQKKT